MSYFEKYIIFLSSNLIPIALLCLLMWYYWTHRKIIAVASKLPALPLLTPLYFITLGRRGFSKFTDQKAKEYVASGKYNGVFWLGPIPYVFISKPEDIQVVANNCIPIGPDIDVLKYFIGTSLPAAPAHIWRVIRRNYQPVFHSRNIELLMPALNQCGRDLALRLSRHVGLVSVDLREDIGISTLTAACCFTFGPDFKINIDSSPSKKFIKLITRLNELVFIRLVRFWLRSDFLFQMAYSKELKDIKTTLEEFLSTSMNKVDSKGHPGGKDAKDSFEGKCGGEERTSEKRDSLPYMRLQDAFEIMRESHPTFTLKNLKEEMISTLLVGTETTQLLTFYCVLALAAHPDIQEAVHAEISAMSKGSGDVTLEELKAMTYLDQVLNETLRMFPILPSVTRTVDKEVKLSFGTLPVGMTVAILTSVVHNNPQFFPDPKVFDPDRFTPDNVAKRPRCSFVPFLIGPRNCIGKALALMEAKTILVHLLRRFKLTTSVDISNMDYVSGLTFRPADLIPVQVKHRG